MSQSDILNREEIFRRREAMKPAINALDRDVLHDESERTAFFERIYKQANGDFAAVPWADLAPKDKLVSWLEKNQGSGKRAIDIGCGLGDNAQALAHAGYQTTAFDLSSDAIDWAKHRFSDGLVDYQTANLLDLPTKWIGAFDVVHECYTLQSVPPNIAVQLMKQIASLVKRGGVLLIYTRVCGQGDLGDGPPWPLDCELLTQFLKHGLTCEFSEDFSIKRPNRTIPHQFSQWRRHA